MSEDEDDQFSDEEQDDELAFLQQQLQQLKEDAAEVKKEQPSFTDIAPTRQSRQLQTAPAGPPPMGQLGRLQTAVPPMGQMERLQTAAPPMRQSRQLQTAPPMRQSRKLASSDPQDSEAGPSLRLKSRIPGQEGGLGGIGQGYKMQRSSKNLLLHMPGISSASPPAYRLGRQPSAEELDLLPSSTPPLRRLARQPSAEESEFLEPSPKTPPAYRLARQPSAEESEFLEPSPRALSAQRLGRQPSAEESEFLQVSKTPPLRRLVRQPSAEVLEPQGPKTLPTRLLVRQPSTEEIEFERHLALENLLNDFEEESESDEDEDQEEAELQTQQTTSSLPRESQIGYSPPKSGLSSELLFFATREPQKTPRGTQDQPQPRQSQHPRQSQNPRAQQPQGIQEWEILIDPDKFELRPSAAWMEQARQTQNCTYESPLEEPQHVQTPPAFQTPPAHSTPPMQQRETWERDLLALGNQNIDTRPSLAWMQEETTRIQSRKYDQSPTFQKSEQTHLAQQSQSTQPRETWERNLLALENRNFEHRPSLAWMQEETAQKYDPHKSQAAQQTPLTQQTREPWENDLLSLENRNFEHRPSLAWMQEETTRIQSTRIEPTREVQQPDLLLMNTSSRNFEHRPSLAWMQEETTRIQSLRKDTAEQRRQEEPKPVANEKPEGKPRRLQPLQIEPLPLDRLQAQSFQIESPRDRPDSPVIGRRVPSEAPSPGTLKRNWQQKWAANKLTPRPNQGGSTRSNFDSPRPGQEGSVRNGLDTPESKNSLRIGQDEASSRGHADSQATRPSASIGLRGRGPSTLPAKIQSTVMSASEISSLLDNSGYRPDSIIIPAQNGKQEKGTVDLAHLSRSLSSLHEEPAPVSVSQSHRRNAGINHHKSTSSPSFPLQTTQQNGSWQRRRVETYILRLPQPPLDSPEGTYYGFLLKLKKSSMTLGSAAGEKIEHWRNVWMIASKNTSSLIYGSINNKNRFSKRGEIDVRGALIYIPSDTRYHRPGCLRIQPQRGREQVICRRDIPYEIEHWINHILWLGASRVILDQDGPASQKILLSLMGIKSGVLLRLETKMLRPKWIKRYCSIDNSSNTFQFFEIIKAQEVQDAESVLFKGKIFLQNCVVQALQKQQGKNQYVFLLKESPPRTGGNAGGFTWVMEHFFCTDDEKDLSEWITACVANGARRPPAGSTTSTSSTSTPTPP